MTGEDDPATAEPGATAPDEESTPAPGTLERLRTAARALQEQIQDSWAAQQYSFVPSAEVVAIDARRHPLVLLTPALRTCAGLALLLLGPLLLPVLWFALVTAVWARVRLTAGLRVGLLVSGASTGVAVLLVSMEGWRPALLLLVLLLGWLAEDVADWYSDRLVVTDKRIYRRHGVITRHSPSISLMAIAYIDAAVPPLGQLLHYGTLRLDSVAQRDAPLSRFDQIPDVVPVSHEILRLRAAAMPKGPPLVY
ncbi:MAG: PH domain-containing protein [Frankiaceae bacterium]|nr:PH domain-containing protein [Frankiaceae bacterium]